MKVVALVSGGKDSCYAMMQSLHYGHQVVALANLLPADDSVDELDSYMYQTVGHQIVISYAKCMGMPLFRRRIQGTTREHSLSYNMTRGDEVEDMFLLLKEVKRRIPTITAVCSGAIASDYQRLRVESVCSRLGLVSLAYLWKQDQSILLQEMINKNIVAITVKVAAIGLDPAKHLGKEIAYLYPYLHKLKDLYGINVCGEGGEYETLTLDCPLFKNARIVLDESQVVLHSSDSIAPVGVLHPSVFHLENKLEHVPLSNSYSDNGVCQEKLDLIYDVEGDCDQKCEAKMQSVDVASALEEATKQNLHISKTNKDDTFSISCCLKNHSRSSTDLQHDLKIVLMKVELQLLEYGYSWENVLYVHLYIADMNEFVKANETYVRFITLEKCRFGVPSRTTIELPLMEAGFGRAYVEVLVANDQSKRVLHVQSISCWAPSCIGPYSQATLHKEVLHIAGQLGLDPPTMLLCSGGPTAELLQTLENCEAVAKSFKCSISTSAMFFVNYCSANVPLSEIVNIQDALDAYLKQQRSLCLDSSEIRVVEVIEPIFLYVHVPNLPKSALVEVKPILYVAAEDAGTESDTEIDCARPSPLCITQQSHWGFQNENWHDSCVQKCVVHGKICTIILSATDELAAKICPGDRQAFSFESQLERIARFCIYLLDKTLLENNFSWDDATNLRIYFPTNRHKSQETLSVMFGDVFKEFAEMSSRVKIINKIPIFNLVPVLRSGRSATSMDDIITCELFARKS